MRGRKPTPTPLKIAAGNPGGRPLNDAEPLAPVSKLKVPAFIKDDPIAVKEFKRLGKLLLAAGVLTVLDEDALGFYAASYSRYVNEAAELANEGTILSGEKGSYANPRLWVVDRAREAMTKMLAEFGMTPSARSRIRGKPGAADVDGTGKGSVDKMSASQTRSPAEIAAEARAWKPPTMDANNASSNPAQ